MNRKPRRRALHNIGLELANPSRRSASCVRPACSQGSQLKPAFGGRPLYPPTHQGQSRSAPPPLCLLWVKAGRSRDAPGGPHAGHDRP